MTKSFRFFILTIFVLACSLLLNGSGAAITYDPVAISSDYLSDAETGVFLLEEDQNGMTVRMDIGNIEFIPVTTDEGTFYLPRIAGFSRSFEVGYPSLPIASKLIAIPFGAKIKAEVLHTESRQIMVPGLLMPVQPPLSKSDDPSTVKFQFKKNIYTTPGKYSLPLAQADILGIMRYTRLGKIAIAPMEYYPTENMAVIYTSVTVRITYKGADWKKTKKMKKDLGNPHFDVNFKSLLNYESTGLTANLVKYPTKYVIVANRMFESQLQPFIQWKTQKGFQVIVGYTDTIGSSTSAIKSWLQNLYNTENPAPSFVLLVGDDQQIPAWSGTAGSHITDLYYCEYTADDFPEIYYGRFSAQNTTQLQPQIDKTLEYEEFTMPDPSYLAEVTLVSGVDSSYAEIYGNGQINYGTNYYFNSAHGITPNVWLYPDSDASGAPAAVKQTISDGVGFYNYTAHCSHDGPADPSFNQTDIANLTNIHKYLLGIGNCCLSNTFGASYSTPCFGEAWLQAPDKGGIGWIGGSNNTYWNEDYWWGVGNGPIVAAGPTYEQTGLGAYDGVFHDHGEDVSDHYITNGAIMFAGNMAVTEAGSSRDTYYWEIYHLMGDPSVMTYMGVPSVNNVLHPASLLTTSGSINVTAAPGSYAGISKDGVLHGSGYIGTGGSANITFTPFGTEGTATLVVTCQNKEPYEANIPVTGATEPPTANFTGTPTSGMVALTVQFTDQSLGATSWDWNFGDGGTSTSANPSHTYTMVGVYTVSLTASNSYGSDTNTKTNYITVTTLLPPAADFSASSTTVYEGDTVNFTDLSTNNPTSWNWTFNGGTPSSSTVKNPAITYNTAGTYSVTLIAGNAAGSDTETKTGYITVQVPPLEYCTSQGNNSTYEWIADVHVADIQNASGAANYTDFTYITGNLTIGQNFNVTLTPGFSSSVYTEHWKIYIDYNVDGDFEDAGEQVFYSISTSAVSGSFTVPANAATGLTRMRVSMKYAAEQTPCEHFSYGEVEDYTVNITGGSPQPPVADFSASATTINEGGSVTFTDLSTNNPDSWDWTFGGGTPSFSTAQNPVITYNTAGTYTVTLIATNAVGSDTETKVNYITVQIPGSCIGTITNPGFETGNTSGWTTTGTVSMTSGNTGSYGVSLVGTGSRVEQTITGLCPNTTYTLAAYGKAKSSAGMYLGVTNYGGSEQTVLYVDSKNFVKLSITFTTGASNTSATIFFKRTADRSDAFGDDFTLVKN